MSLANFFAMGGYAAYVWPAYGFCAVVLIVQIIKPILQQKRLVNKIKQAVLEEQP